MYLVPYKGEHFAALGALQAAQSSWVRLVTLEQARALEAPHSVTLIEDGLPLMCAGVLPVWGERGYMWSFISDRLTAPLFRRMHTLAKQFVDGVPFRRVEAAVEVDFTAGHRWLKTLGFVCETPTTVARCYLPNGADCLLYARIKD